MNAVVTNENMLQMIAHKYDVGYILFVNQLDLLNASTNDYRDYGLDNFKRVANVHYTLMNMEGKEIVSGMAKNTFSSNLNRPALITQTVFPALSKHVINEFPMSKSKIVKEETPVTGNKVAPNFSLPKLSKSSKEDVKKSDDSTLSPAKEEKVEEEKDDIFDDY